MILKANNPILKELRTIHPKMVKDPFSYTVLKPASDNNKLGKGDLYFTKGKWRGMPLFSLTLEERKTCPSDCKRLRDCYANSMSFAHRFKHGIRLQQKLTQELSYLTKKYPQGIVIRLHIAGDFYSVKYVNFWRSALLKYNNLYIFGYTARLNGPIYESLNSLINEIPNRFKIRFSVNRDFDSAYPNTIYTTDQSGSPNALLCPEMTGKTKSCLTCGLCFGINRTIKFNSH